MSDERPILTASEADRLLASADGTAALLYLHILRSGGYSAADAARVLRRSAADVALAADTLRRLGLLSERQPGGETRTPPEPERKLPELSTRDIRDVAGKDPAFQGLVAEAESALGRVLSDNDLRILFGIYDHLGLPADVILLLLHHCIETYQARSGPGRMPTMRYVEKEGWYWADREILNLDAAEEHLRQERARGEAQEQIKAALGIRGRELTPGERRYVDGWIAMGFGPEALAIAYDRTMLRTGRLQWKYMDSIVKSWDEKHLHTPEEIAASDPAARGKTAARPASEGEKLEQMRKMVEQMTGKQSGKGE